MIEVTVQPSKDRQLTVGTNIDDLVTLYDATRDGKRTQKQRDLLKVFGDALLAADKDLATVVKAAQKEAAKKPAKPAPAVAE